MGLFGDVIGAVGARKASKQQKRLTRNYQKQMAEYQTQLGDLSNLYTQKFEDLAANFNPYDLQAEFDSLYEGVIAPMEHQFNEITLSQIRGSYSGGGYGSAMFSGARPEAEAQARQTLSLQEALLRNQARGEGIQRNFSEYARQTSDLGMQYNLKTSPIMAGLGIADQTYAAKQDTIGARLAATGAFGQAIGGVEDKMEEYATKAVSLFAKGGF